MRHPGTTPAHRAGLASLQVSAPRPDSLAARLIAVARALHDSGAVVGSLGNVSARSGAGFLITPTRRPYIETEPGDLVLVDAEGNASGPHPPSREWRLHAAVYARRPDVGGVVHTHSPHATAWSFLDEPLEPQLEDNEYYATGPIRTAPAAPAGSAAGVQAATVLGDSAAVLLGRHGVLATGADPEGAATIAAVIERQAQIAWLLRSACTSPACRSASSESRR